MKLVLLALFATSGSGVSQVLLAAGHPTMIRAADLNHDGRPDLVVADLDAGEVRILLNGGAGKFHTATERRYHADIVAPLRLR